MTYLPPEQFSRGGQSNNPDYITYETDDSGPPRNWRRETPPPGEDGSIKPRAITVTDSPNPLPPQANPPGVNS